MPFYGNDNQRPRGSFLMRSKILLILVIAAVIFSSCTGKAPVSVITSTTTPTQGNPPTSRPPATLKTASLTPTTPVPAVTNAPPAQNGFIDPVKIDSGYISGALIGESGKEVTIYKGIPYAAPPVGDLRWKAPQPPASWSGVRQCVEFSHIAPQPLVTPGLTQDEDCLYLNVLTPAKTTAEKFPVMVWLHQGGYSQASGNEAVVNLPRLPRNGIVLVTVNMRLGALGLLAHPLLDKESPNGVSGNYLFLDIIASLKWVQSNIAVFGGDPANVTIFGLSGGGAKVTQMMVSPLAKGLFQRAIAESGTSIIPDSPAATLNDVEALGKRFFTKLGVDNSADPLKSARALPWQQILKADLAANPSGSGLAIAAVDGWFLPDTPVNIVTSGKMNAVPFIALTSLGELAGTSPTGIYPYIPAADAWVLDALDKAGVKGYACLFDYVPDKWRQEGMTAVHTLERNYVFGDWDNQSAWTDGYYSKFSPYLPSLVKDPGLNEVDRKVSETMMAMWTRFAKTGDPNIPGLASWPVYQATTDRYLYINEALNVKSGFSALPEMK